MRAAAGDIPMVVMLIPDEFQVEDSVWELATARIAGRNDRLTTRFGRLVDIAREAAFLASKGTGNVVEAVRHLRTVMAGIRKLQHMDDAEIMAEVDAHRASN